MVHLENDLFSFIFLLTFPVSCWALFITIVDIFKAGSENESKNLKSNGSRMLSKMSTQIDLSIS